MLIRVFALATLLTASATQAQTVFSDNFNADLRGLNKTTFVGGWTVGSGGVDVIGTGPGQAGDATNVSYFPANGNFIDLDASMGSGIFTKAVTLAGGTRYVATFELAGSQRSSTQSVNVAFGTTSATFSYGSLAPFVRSALAFTPTSTGSYTLSFDEPGASDDEGLLLDNVVIGAVVPEPVGCGATLATIAGLGRRFSRRKPLERHAITVSEGD